LAYDLLWKYLRDFSRSSIDSPRKVFQECLSLGLVSREETKELTDLIEDRNLTTHVYDVDLANQVAHDIQKHPDAMSAVIMKVSLDTIKK